MVTAQISGGLGNQLFTYVRLATYAYEHGFNLQIDGSIAERVLGRQPDLFDFKLSGEHQISVSSYNWLSVQLERILWRTKALRALTRRHQENLLGSSDLSARNLDGWKIRGFFQDFRVAEEYFSIFGKNAMTLKNESDTLRKLSQELENQTPMAIHVRRGDYLNYQASFGLLDYDYYLNAFRSLIEKFEYSEVIIFTDSPDMISELQKKIPLRTRLISPTQLSPSETMTLMSRCSGLVASNSTFSFWAGMLADHSRVIIPSPWFKSRDSWLQSANFVNPRWLKQEVIWSTK